MLQNMATYTSDDDGHDLVVVTGGAGGVGMACARLLGQTADVVLIDRRAEPLAHALSELAADGLTAQTITCDVTHPGSVAEAVKHVSDLGRLRTLVHAAGISPSMGDSRTILDVNLLGTVNVVDGFQPLAHRGTTAVCIASIAAHRRPLTRFDPVLIAAHDTGDLARLIEFAEVEGRPGLAYSLAKRGIVLLVERRAHRWGAEGARLLSISPGFIADTEMGRLEAGSGAGALRRGRGSDVHARTSALGRTTLAGDVAGVVALLSSQQAAFVTGCDLRVDGGMVPGILWQSDPETARMWEEPDLL
jgi:NAD(P)-dependent dehydrogenase (short-subunit alcohol dehydrogenase family)